MPYWIPFTQDYDGVWCRDRDRDEVRYFSWEEVTCDKPEIHWADGPADIMDDEKG